MEQLISHRHILTSFTCCFELCLSPAIFTHRCPQFTTHIQSKSQRHNEKCSVIDLLKTYLHSDSNYHSIPDVLGKTSLSELLTEKEEPRPVTMLWNKHVVISLFSPSLLLQTPVSCNWHQNCWDIVLKQGNFREQKNLHPFPVPSIQIWGVCFFSIGSSNISTTLHGWDGGGKAIFPPFEVSKL